MDNLSELFEATLMDVYFAENAILTMLPKMSRQAASVELRVALDDHLQETRDQVDRLEEVFRRLGKEAEGRECPAIKGLLQETEALLAGAHDPDVLDAGLIGCAQALEHFEMGRYGTLIVWAERLGMIEIAEILEDSLEEEETAEDRLMALALGPELSAAFDESSPPGTGPKARTH